MYQKVFQIIEYGDISKRTRILYYIGFTTNFVKNQPQFREL